MNYFKISLKQYCQTDFPELAKDENFLEERSLEATKEYAFATKNRGMSHTKAIELAYDVLYKDLDFSKIAFVRNVIECEFFESFDSDHQIQTFAVELSGKTEANEIFSRYQITNGEVENEDGLYTEITGFISEYVQTSF